MLLDHFVMLPRDDDRYAVVDAKTKSFRVFTTKLQKCGWGSNPGLVRFPYKYVAVFENKTFACDPDYFDRQGATKDSGNGS